MKVLICLFITCFYFSSANSTLNQKSLSEIKIDQSWRVKYNAEEWSYKFVKIFSGITPHIFENKKENLRLVLQKETHLGRSLQEKSFVSNKCTEAQSFYSQNKSGRAFLEKINNTETCFIEYKNESGNSIFEYVVPQVSKGNSYELYTYAWTNDSKSGKSRVHNFLKEFLK